MHGLSLSFIPIKSQEHTTPPGRQPNFAPSTAYSEEMRNLTWQNVSPHTAALAALGNASPHDPNASPHASPLSAPEEPLAPSEPLASSEPSEPAMSWQQASMEQRPSLPTRDRILLVHPSLGRHMVRGRGEYWWDVYQVKAEETMKKGWQPRVGEFLCFLVDTEGQAVYRYGNVFMGDHWIRQTVAVPNGHPDAEREPYAMTYIGDDPHPSWAF